MATQLLTPGEIYDKWESGEQRTPGVAVVAAEGLQPSGSRRIQSAAALVRPLLTGEHSIAEIVSLTGLTASQVRSAFYVFRRRGEPVRFRRVRPRSYEEAIRLVAAGQPLSDAIRLAGLNLDGRSRRKVRDACEARGITIPPPRKPAGRPPAAWHLEAVRLRAEGGRPAEIAARFGVTAAAVRHALRQL